MRAKLVDLGPRERAVAEAMIAQPEALSRLGAADLAALVGTSAATVTRACQSLGFSGYPHLRTLLVRDAGAAELASRDGSEPAHAVQRMYAEAARELEAAAATIDLDAFQRSVAIVAGARRLVIVGGGSSAPTVASATLSFLLAGVVAETSTDPVQQLLTCRLLTEADAVIAVSDSGENSATLAAVDAARTAGAALVAVTSFPRSKLSRAAQEALIVSAAGRPWPESVLTSTIMQTFLLNAFVVEVAARRDTEGATRTVTEDVLRAVTGSRRPGD